MFSIELVIQQRHKPILFDSRFVSDKLELRKSFLCITQLYFYRCRNWLRKVRMRKRVWSVWFKGPVELKNQNLLNSSIVDNDRTDTGVEVTVALERLFVLLKPFQTFQIRIHSFHTTQHDLRQLWNSFGKNSFLM